MTSIGDVTINLDLQPSEKANELIESIVRKQLAGKFAALLKEFEACLDLEKLAKMVADELRKTQTMAIVSESGGPDFVTLPHGSSVYPNEQIKDPKTVRVFLDSKVLAKTVAEELANSIRVGGGYYRTVSADQVQVPISELGKHGCFLGPKEE